MVNGRGRTGAGVVIMLLTLGGTAGAQTTPPTRAESIVVPITAAAEKFQKAVGEGLGQRLEELRAGLKESGARVRAALEVAQREGTDAANAKYEEVALARSQPALQRRQRNPQGLGGLETMAVMLLHHGADVRELVVAEGPALRPTGARIDATDRLGQVVDVDGGTGRDGTGALDRVFELANVAGPSMAQHARERRCRVAGTITGPSAA